MRRVWREHIYMSYPCGWWELHPHICMCTSLDMLGWKLNDGDPILFVSKFLMCAVDQEDLLRIKNLHVDFMYRRGRVVQFRGKFGDSECFYDAHGVLRVSEIVTTKPFRHMLHLAQHFLKYTRPKLQSLRRSSLILQSLHYCEIMCLLKVNACTKRHLFLAPDALQLTDATLTRCLRHTACLKHVQTNWIWQQFTNRLNQSIWCWRMADDDWFIVSGQHIGHGPAGVWKRYRDPTSNKCFWWRNDNDWGWEYLAGEFVWLTFVHKGLWGQAWYVIQHGYNWTGCMTMKWLGRIFWGCT